MNEVLSVNYYGELLAIDLLGRAVGSGVSRDLLLRQQHDEARHAEQTRVLLLARGYDPDLQDSPAIFSFAPVFAEYTGGGPLPALACLCENEILASRNFRLLARIAGAFGDTEVEALYRAIAVEEAGHAAALAAALPDDPDVAASRAAARVQMERVVSDRYLRLLAVSSAVYEAPRAPAAS